MKKFLNIGNDYVAQSDWKDLALIKFCLCAMGILLGIHVKPKHKKPVAICALVVFAATYLPLMGKLAKLVLAKDEDSEYDELEDTY